MKKAQSRIQSKEKRRKLSNRTVTIITFATLILLGILLFWLTRNQSLFVADQQAVRQRLEAALSAAEFPGTLVYEEIEDKGCDDRSSVGLAYRVHCDYVGYKIYKNRGNVSQDIAVAEEALRDHGLKKNLGGFRDGDAIGETGELTLRLRQHTTVPKDTDPVIRRLIDDGRIAAPVKGEYLYGVHADVRYFSCSNDFVAQPCPDPPSEPR